MKKKNFNVALVGCGSIAPNHLGAISELENVKVVALCDLNTEKAADRANQYSLDVNIYDDFDKMLDCEELDAIHIATPHYLHAPMTIKALEKNINVFLEKPAAISEKELDDMIAAEEKSTASVCVCFQNRFNPSTIIAEKIANEDGGVRAAFGSVFWYRSAPYYTESGWRGAYKTEGGGVMINQAIHTIDLLCYYLGKPESVIATIANHHLKDTIEVEDSCEGIINFDNGKHANFYATTAFDGKDSTILYLVTKNHTIQIQSPNVYLDGVKIDDASLVADFCGKECYGNGHKYLISKYYDSLSNGTQVPVPLKDATYALKVLLAAYRSYDKKIKIL